ncbi:putative deoxyribonuclease TATDN2, partial [Bienertia sinuspersici]
EWDYRAKLAFDPTFGVHPWFVLERTTGWFTNLREYFESIPSAAVEVFRRQLELAKELKRLASVHCVSVRAFGDLLDVMKSTGQFSFLRE